VTNRRLDPTPAAASTATPPPAIATAAIPMTVPLDSPERCAGCKALPRGAEEFVPSDALPQAVREHLPPAAQADDAEVCAVCLASARMAELIARLGRERGELGELEKAVANRIAKGHAVTRNVDSELAKTATAGQRLADSVARIGGSWPFVVGACVVIAIWTGLNALFSGAAFDPFPYVFLNLVLSCLAALQAPIIMMSQNRAQARDRMAAEQDFQVNLKSELEITALHAKLDHLMHIRWESLLEMQDLQLQLLRSLEARQSPADERR